MTRFFQILLILVGCRVGMPLSYGETASAILHAHIRAAGGSKVLSQVKTVTIEGRLVRQSDGRQGSYRAIAKAPDFFFSEITLGDDHASEAFNGKSAWRIDLSGQITTLTGDEAAVLACLAASQGSRSFKDKASNPPRLGGREQVRGRDTFRLEFLTQGRAKRTTFFDAQNHLIVKDRIEAGYASEEMIYGDYQLSDGVMEPTWIEIKRWGHTFLISNVQVRHNVAVDDSGFDFPAAKEALPDVTRLLTEVQNNQRRIDEILENYTFHKREEETEVKSGQLAGGTRTTEYEVFYVGGREIEKLIGRNGMPLTAAEQDKETRKTSELVAKYERESKGAGRLNTEDSSNEDELHISTFLRACRFTHPRREQFRGQRLIAFDIEPNPAYHPRNTNERLARDLEGVMWVDSHVHQVVRLEARLAGSARFGAGLLGIINQGSTAIFEQALVNNEVWLPSYLEVRLAGRILLFKKYQKNLIIRFGDYKRFRVDTTEQYKPPKPP